MTVFYLDSQTPFCYKTALDQRPKHYTDAEIEFLLKKKAVEEVLNDTRPDVPNDEVIAMMERELAEIEQDIATRLGE